MRTSTSVRIDEDAKMIASEVLKQYGMSLSEGINLFCKQVAMTYSIPFELKVPTERMQKALKELEKRQISFEVKTDERLKTIFNAIETKEIKPKQGIFYDGQVYDAYAFINNLLKNAKSEVVLIDNYIDDTIFTLFSKYPKINFKIYTTKISKQLELDFSKYQTQYKNIEIIEFKKSHDRFLIVDNIDIYHLGASLKDLGKKWFAFSKFEIESFDILEKLK